MFGPSNTTKTAENNLSGTSNLALNNLFPTVTGKGEQQFNAGAPNINAGTGFFNSILNGNRADATATLQPDIDRIREAHANTLKAINTLMPRGGGRSSALFNESFAPTGEIGNLFSAIRPQAAAALPQIGLQQQQQGLGYFGLGAPSLGAATTSNANLGNLGQTQQQMTNSLFSGLGSSLFSLATTPFGGGSSTNGLLGLIK